MDLVTKARERRVELVAELARIDRFLESADEMARELGLAPAAAPAPQTRKLARRGTGAETLNAVAAIIEAQGPMSTRDLVPLVLERGIEIGGKDAIATLSARISKKGVVELDGGKWRLMTLGTSGASALQENEATDESVHERSAAPLFNQAEEGGTYHAAALA